MMAWLVRYEAFPEFFARSIQGYPGLIARDVLISDSWMKLKFGNADVGYTHTNMDTGNREAGEAFLLSNRTHIDITLMGEPRGAYASGTAALDARYRLQRFSFVLSTAGVRVSVKGKRAHENTFEIDLDTGSGPERMTVDIPDDVVIHSPLAFLSLKRLRPGQEVAVATLDPVSLEKVTVMVKAIGTETIESPEGPVKTTVLSSNYRDMEFRTWVDADGRVMRQESPFGWVAERCTREEALAVSGSDDAGVEILQILTTELLSPELQP